MSAPPQNEASPDTDPAHDGYGDLPGPDKMSDEERDKFGAEIEALDWKRFEEPEPAERQVFPAPSEPMKVARRIAAMRTLGGVSLLRRWRGDWLEWTGAHWETLEDAAVTELLYHTLENVVYAEMPAKPWDPNRTKIGNVADALVHAVAPCPVHGQADQPLVFVVQEHLGARRQAQGVEML